MQRSRGAYVLYISLTDISSCPCQSFIYIVDSAISYILVSIIINFIAQSRTVIRKTHRRMNKWTEIGINTDSRQLSICNVCAVLVNPKPFRTHRSKCKERKLSFYSLSSFWNQPSTWAIIFLLLSSTWHMGGCINPYFGYFYLFRSCAQFYDLLLRSTAHIIFWLFFD